MLINKREDPSSKNIKNSEAFTEYSNDMNDIDKNIEEYNPNKTQKMLIVLDDLVTDMLGNKKPNPIVNELCLRRRK